MHNILCTMCNVQCAFNLSQLHWNFVSQLNLLFTIESTQLASVRQPSLACTIPCVLLCNRSALNCFHMELFVIEHKRIKSMQFIVLLQTPGSTALSWISVPSINSTIEIACMQWGGNNVKLEILVLPLFFQIRRQIFMAHILVYFAYVHGTYWPNLFQSTMWFHNGLFTWICFRLQC